MDSPDARSPAAKLKWVLLTAMALVMAWAAISAYLQSKVNLQRLNSWTRHEALVTNTDRGFSSGRSLDNLYAWMQVEPERWGWVEVEIADVLATRLHGVQPAEDPPLLEPGKARVWLLREPYAWHESFDAVQIIQDPAQPERFFVLNGTGMWFIVAAKLLLAALLALCWRWLSLAPWGGDRTWTNGAWRETDSFAVRPGSGVLLEPPITEPRGNQVFAALLGVAIALPYALWMLNGVGRHPLGAGIQLVISLAVLSVSLRSIVKKHTRRVQYDAAGICDEDFFGWHRVPWNSVKALTMINLNAKAQQQHDRNRRRFKSHSSERPEDRPAWNVCGEQGVILLQLDNNMVPQDALAALRKRIKSQLTDGGNAVGLAKQQPAARGPTASRLSAEEAQVYRSHGRVPPAAAAVDPFAQDVDARTSEAEAADEGGRVLDPNDPRDQKIILEGQQTMRQFDLDMAIFEQRSKSTQRGMQVFMVLIVLGLLWGAGYYAWQSLWFEASLLGGLMLFIALLAGAVWWGTMRAAKPDTKAKRG